MLEAKKARRIYEDIVRQMRDPALLEYVGRDLVKLRIFPIEPHQVRRVRFQYSQMLRRENPCNADDAQGLGAFAQFGWAPPERSVAEQYWGGGIVYKGLIPCRDDDTCGIGIGNMTFGDLFDQPLQVTEY